VFACALAETAGSVGEERIDLARIRGEVGPRERLAALVARNLLQQLLELVDVAIDGFAELGVAAILLADFLEALLAGVGVEAAVENATLATLEALQRFGGCFVIDHAGDVDRERVE